MKNPQWLKKRISNLDRYRQTNEILKAQNIKTVCHSAKCPNIHECFGRSYVTFMILGDNCTRRCAFCFVKKSVICPPEDESQKILKAVKELALDYVMITSPTRDDLPDGGAIYFAMAIKTLKAEISNIKIEALVPDFQGSLESAACVLQSGVDVFAHNIETVERFYPQIRPQADYERSLLILKEAKKISYSVTTKSSIMLGFGEKREEVEETLRDLKRAGVDGICMGQYLAPSKECIKVKEFITPEQFDYFNKYALGLGFKFAFSGPWVRSSYRADELNKIKVFRQRLSRGEQADLPQAEKTKMQNWRIA